MPNAAPSVFEGSAMTSVGSILTAGTLSSSMVGNVQNNLIPRNNETRRLSPVSKIEEEIEEESNNL